METCLLAPAHDAALAAADATMSLLAIDQYLRQVQWIAPLTPEEETRLLRRLHESRTAPDDAWKARVARQARDRIVEAYQPLISRLSRRFARVAHSMDLMDCVQEGSIGLLAAIDRYRLHFASPFEAYAILSIRGAIVRAMRYKDNIIRTPECLQVEFNCIWKTLHLLHDQWNRWPTEAEVAAVVGTMPERVTELLCLFQCRLVVSLEGFYGAEQDSEGDDCADPEERLSFTWLWPCLPSRMASVDVVQVVEEAMQVTLTARQREVMELRYGLNGHAPHSQLHTSKVLGYTAPYSSVQQHEYRARRKLQQVLAPVVGEWVS